MRIFFRDDPIGGLIVLVINLGPPLLPLLPGLILALWARRRLLTAARSGSKAPLAIDGATAAATIVGDSGARIVEGAGPLATFYDAGRREVRLTPEAASGRSALAVAVAAREAGLALADPAFPLVGRLRTPIVLGARLAAGVAWLTLAAGLLMFNVLLCYDGAMLHAASVLASLAVVAADRVPARRAREALGAVGDDLSFRSAFDAAGWRPVAATLPRLGWRERGPLA